MKTYAELVQWFTDYPYSCITVGDLKRIIEKYPSDEIPFSIVDYGSWRGIYAHPYITPSTEISKKEDLLRDLEVLTQYDFEGWKGGWYQYVESDLLHFEWDASKSSIEENDSCFLSFIRNNPDNLFVLFLIKNL